MNVQTRIETCTCPTCGGYIGEAKPIGQIVSSMRGSERFLMDILSAKPGSEVTLDFLVAKLYGDRLNTPINQRANIATIINRLNMKLALYGWCIASKGRGRGKKASYRLIPTVGGA